MAASITASGHAARTRIDYGHESVGRSATRTLCGHMRRYVGGRWIAGDRRTTRFAQRPTPAERRVISIIFARSFTHEIRRRALDRNRAFPRSIT